MIAGADRLRELVAADGWTMGVLRTVRAAGLPDAWVGAGVIRDLAVRLDGGERIEICAPLGLDDLLGGVRRRNPARVGVDASLAPLARRRPQARWPEVRVIAAARAGRGSV